LAGALDTKFVALAEALRSKVEAVTVVPDAGHDLVLEAPDAVAEALVAARYATS
jgi:pimeloyl-ACP methyl ester carboxylesterase